MSLKLLMFVLLLRVASAVLLVENQYYEKHCSSAPDTIYVFNVEDPFAYDATSNETFPSYYRFHCGDVTVDDAANCYVSMPGIACTDSLDSTLSFPYLSGSTTRFKGISEIEASIPIFANGNTYCQLDSSNITLATLLGFKAVLFLGKDNHCYDNHFICNKDGSFYYYELPNCSGQLLDHFVIDLNPNLIYTNYLGNVTVQLKTFENAQVIYSWDQHCPIVDLVPQFEGPIDYIAGAVFGLSIVISLYLPTTTITNYYNEKKKLQLLNYIVLTGDFFLFFWTIMATIFWRMAFPDAETMSIFAEFRQDFFNIGSLLFTMRTGFILQATFFGSQKWITVLIQGIVLIVHLVCVGASYLEYIFNGGDNNLIVTMDQNIAQFLSNWGEASYFWIIFMFVWNSLPPILISLYLIRLKFNSPTKGDLSNLESITKLFQIDKRLPYFLAGQSFTIFGYLLVKYIRNETYILGSDIVCQDMSAFSTLLMILHILQSAKINDTIKISLRYKQSALVKTSTFQTTTNHAT
ncbi:hypothetical protein HDV06_000694 [Boothiomyces sp. JEL0866]|nr:hypothetical protein HDV06_000694 [Boothiomyces sp. JEL0866]